VVVMTGDGCLVVVVGVVVVGVVVVGVVVGTVVFDDLHVTVTEAVLSANKFLN
jgi:hypothetical protein